MTRISAFSVLVSLILITSSAAADDAPRQGRLMSLLQEVPGIWLASDRVFGRESQAPLSACAQDRCAAVVETEACASPACPGNGFVHRVERAVANVPDWPTDVEGYMREFEALSADPTLSALGLNTHPDAGPWQQRQADADRARQREERRHDDDVRWVSRHREDGDRLELSLSGDLATLTETGGTYAGVSAGLGLVYYADANDAEDEEDDFLLNFLLGDMVGVELRAHFLYRTDSPQEAEWMTLVGLATPFMNRIGHSIVRVPSLAGLMLPEVGMALRSDRGPTWYVAWDLPVSLLVHHDLAVDLSARVLVVDEWIEWPDNPDDPAEVILVLGAGFRLP